MNIVFAAAEAVPFVKVGGLGDVIGSLPAELVRIGHKCSVFLPYYSKIKGEFELFMEIEEMNTKVYKTNVKGVEFYLVKHDSLFRDVVYGTNDEEDAVKFARFSRAILHVVEEKLPETEVLHSHDWHTAVIPTYLKERGSRIKSVFTIHNLAFQGVVRPLLLDMVDISWNRFNVDELEFHGKANLMKGAVVNSQAITTVSKSYAKEILTPEEGFGLDGVLRWQGWKLEGVVNGLDYEHFDPAKDSALVANYSHDNMGGKAACREALIRECGFDVNGGRPIFGFVSRLTYQKGIDIIVEALQEIVESGADIAMLGSGNHEIEKFLKSFEERHHGRFKLFTGFDLSLAQRIYSGSDFYLMPSKFEPCGLSQLIAMRYGVIPVARAVGGLKDTIEEGNTGFLFGDYSASELVASIRRAVDVYNDKALYNRMVNSAMTADFSWEKSAKEYERIYMEAMER